MFFINKTLQTTRRFDLQRFIERVDGAYEITNSYILIALRQLPAAGIFTIRTTPYRPEMISYEIYSDTQYWPYLMEYNNILELTDLTIGTQLNYFSLDKLEDLYLTLTSRKFAI